MSIADIIAVMNCGRVEQLGSPRELYESPRTAFVANFLGSSNLLSGQVLGSEGPLVVVSLADATLRVPRAKVHTQAPSVYVGVRPEKLHIDVAQRAVPASHNAITGVVTDATFAGIGTEYTVALPDGISAMRVFAQNQSTGRPYATGTRVTLHWELEHTFVLDGSDDPKAGERGVAHTEDQVAVGVPG